jgi:hypothetical protein
VQAYRSFLTNPVEEDAMELDAILRRNGWKSGADPQAAGA